MKSLESFHDEYPACPHCGHIERDAWEIDFGAGMEGDTKTTCGACDKEFMVERHCSITYSTRKIEEPK